MITELLLLSFVRTIEVWHFWIINLLGTVTDSYRTKKCEEEAQLNEELAKILSSAEVRKIVGGLLTEIRFDVEQIKSLVDSHSLVTDILELMH